MTCTVSDVKPRQGSVLKRGRMSVPASFPKGKLGLSQGSHRFVKIMQDEPRQSLRLSVDQKYAAYCEVAADNNIRFIGVVPIGEFDQYTQDHLSGNSMVSQSSEAANAFAAVAGLLPLLDQGDTGPVDGDIAPAIRVSVGESAGNTEDDVPPANATDQVGKFAKRYGTTTVPRAGKLRPKLRLVATQVST
ncbi:MAG: hypothetical protein RIQ72_53 [Candidatus Parcubacteria bacterium]